MIGASPVRSIQVHRQRIVRRWWPWSCADFFRVGRPVNGERVRTPHRLKKLAIGSAGKPVRDTSRIGQAHFYRICRRSLRLFGAGILQTVTARAHIPEIAANKIALESVVMEHRREGRVHVALRLAIAEPRSHRSWVRHGGLIQRLYRPGESGLRRMAEAASFVLMDG